MLITLGTFKWLKMYSNDIGAEIKSSKSNITCAIQYCVPYSSSFRSICRHCEKAPKSYKFPVNIPDGIFPHESKTEIKHEI